MSGGFYELSFVRCKTSLETNAKILFLMRLTWMLFLILKYCKLEFYTYCDGKE